MRSREGVCQPSQQLTSLICNRLHRATGLSCTLTRLRQRRSASAETRIFTTSMFSWRQAAWSGVHPSWMENRRVRSACTGVIEVQSCSLTLSVALISAPEARSTFTSSKYPRYADSCKGDTFRCVAKPAHPIHKRMHTEFQSHSRTGKSRKGY